MDELEFYDGAWTGQEIDAGIGLTGTLANALAVVVDGNKAAVSAAIGQYVIVKNSTITSITDGLYTAAQAIPANVAIDATYLTAVSRGGLNDIVYQRTQRVRAYTLTIIDTDHITSIGNWRCYRIGQVVFLQVSGQIGATPAGNQDLVGGIPTPQAAVSFVVTSSAGTISLAINSASGVLAVKKYGTNATPVGYYVGTVVYFTTDD